MRRSGLPLDRRSRLATLDVHLRGREPAHFRNGDLMMRGSLFSIAVIAVGGCVPTTTQDVIAERALVDGVFSRCRTIGLPDSEIDEFLSEMRADRDDGFSRAFQENLAFAICDQNFAADLESECRACFLGMVDLVYGG